MKPGGLYLHVPFCRRGCDYCHFYKERYDPATAGRAVAAMCREIEMRAAGLPAVDTLYLGGGSPSLLPEDLLHRLLQAASAAFRLPAGAEITIEANPEDLNPRLLHRYRELGINRLSVGVQSFQPQELRRLGRHHSAGCGRRALAQAAAAGFENVGVDLMIGIPGQEWAGLAASLAAARDAGAAHLSLYILEGVAGKRVRTPAGREENLYERAREQLAAWGYAQYEVSNFSRPGLAGRHNLKYWENLPYLGIGPSAASYLDGEDSVTTADLASYCDRLGRGALPRRRRRRIKPEIRRLVTGLRLLLGLPSAAFASFPEATRFLKKNGLLREKRGRLAVPAERMLLLNEILLQFL